MNYFFDWCGTLDSRRDLVRMAKFYQEVFDLEIINREPRGAIYMSDGYLTVAILKNRGEAAPSGFNHFGFQVEDMEEIERKAI